MKPSVFVLFHMPTGISLRWLIGLAQYQSMEDGAHRLIWRLDTLEIDVHHLEMLHVRCHSALLHIKLHRRKNIMLNPLTL